VADCVPSEKTLKELMVQQRNKIEEIKKKTNYYTTKSLLDRYDDTSAGVKIPYLATSYAYSRL